MQQRVQRLAPQAAGAALAGGPGPEGLLRGLGSLRVGPSPHARVHVRRRTTLDHLNDVPIEQVCCSAATLVSVLNNAKGL